MQKIPAKIHLRGNELLCYATIWKQAIDKGVSMIELKLFFKAGPTDLLFLKVLLIVVTGVTVITINFYNK